jgi:hypothetical protein
MDITDNKYIKFVFDELGKAPGRRYSSLFYRKLYFDTAMARHDKDRIETAVTLLKMSGYVEEKEGGTPIMNLVLATEDKGNKVIEYDKRVEITVDLLGWLPFEEKRQNNSKLLYELTGDDDSFFPASDETIIKAINEAGIQLPQSFSSRIDVYEYVMQKTEKPAYERFLNALSEKIENQEAEEVQPTRQQPSPVTNVNISNPIIIENMLDSKIKTTDKSHTKNVIVNGNDNQIVTDSKNTTISNEQGVKTKQYWLQILYWVVSILVAGIAIYKFIIE